MELQIQNLTKRYGEKVALDHVSCTLQDGVYGLLGANGAGKSTLMNIITGNVQADQGAVFFNGKNILEPDKEQAFRKCLGYMPQSPVQYRGFTVEDFLYYMAALRGMHPRNAKRRIGELLELLELTDARTKKMTALSGGMKQRMMLAQAVLANPKVLILDEPTAGLDPKQRIAVRNLISRIAFDKIVMIATHVVTDVEFISKEIILLKDGRILKKAERESLTEELQGKVFEIQAPLEKLKQIQKDYLVGNLVKEREQIYVRVVADEKPKEAYIREVKSSLEDVYLYYFRE